MTNYQQPGYPQQPTPKRGMPGWLMALIIVLLIIVLGCGGCFVTCTFLARKTVEKADSLGKQIQQELEKERKAQEERLRQLQTRPAGAPSDDAPAAALPADFPSDIPLYAGAKFQSSNEEGDRNSFTFSVPATPQEITDFYKTRMPQQGWKQTRIIRFLMGFEKDGRSIALNSFTSGEGSTLVIDHFKK